MISIIQKIYLGKLILCLQFNVNLQTTNYSKFTFNLIKLLNYTLS